MNFLELANRRYSVRKYRKNPVEKEKMIRCIEAARVSPSACNSQPWYFVIVDDREVIKMLSKGSSLLFSDFNRFIKDATAIVVVVEEKQNFYSKLGSILKKCDLNLIDIGIASEHFCLQAVEEGLGTCMIGWLNERRIKKVLSIPKSRRIPLMITVGYPEDEAIKGKNRKEIENIYSFNRYRPVKKF